MRDTMLRLALRTVAVVIAVAALFDPVMTLTRPAPQTIVVAQLASANVDAVAAEIRSAVAAADVQVRPVTSGRLPCAPGESCVMVADGTISAELPDDIDKVALIRLPMPAGPNVVMQSAVSASTQSLAGAGTVRVTLAGTGVAGRQTELQVTDGAATVGTLEHTWAADGTVTVDVPWWPVGEGARVLRVAAAPIEGEASALDNAIDVGVTVSPTRARVLIFDARPSWASAFVRRALEDDARFQVEHRVGLAPSLAAGTAGGRLDPLTLDAVGVAVIGGPERLSAADATLLERFVRQRGGTLILVPDQALSGAAAGLVRGQWSEHLEETASPVGPLRASETLRLSNASPADLVLASAQDRPAIVVSPAGRGRIVVSGAMDAWRYRDADGGAFDRFWRSLVLESSVASAALRVEPAQATAAPGARVPFVVRHHQMAEADAATLTASAGCGDEPMQAVRLWPAAEAGVYSGTLSTTAAGSCLIRVAVDDGPVSEGGVVMTMGPTDGVPSVLAKLERGVVSRGGVAGDAPAVIAMLSGNAAVAVPTPVHPMRSPWWLSPFVLCLGVEWWLRRRAGLR